MSRIKTYLKNPYIRIIFILSIAYWPVLFCVASLKWDAMNISVPWRHYIANTILQGELPLWYPNQFFGMCQYIDPQTWYWPAWLLSVFGYTNITLHIEFMLHIFIAAIGCYKLCKHLKINDDTAVTMGLVYAMSGFFIGNAQHIGWIVSATWIPVVIYQFFSYMDTLKWRNIILLNLSLYLLISGGYWSFVVGTYYFLIFSFIYILITKKRKEYLSTEYIHKLITRTPILILLNILTSFVVLSSLYDSMHLISRGEMNIDFTLFGSFFPIDLLSLFAPIATYARTNNFWETDVSLTNLYIGVFPLFVLIWHSIFRLPTVIKQWKIIVLMLLVVFFTMGESLPIRAWFSEYVPLFNYFRYPSAFRAYVILCACILSGILIDNIQFDKKSFKQAVLFYGILLVAVSLITYYYNRSVINDFISNIILKPTKFPIPFLFIIQLGISASLLVFYFISHKISENKKLLFRFFIVLELIISTQLLLPNTVVDISRSPWEINSDIKKNEKINNSIFLNNNTIQQMHDISTTKFPYGRNADTYTNLISPYSYSSYRFSSTIDLANDSILFYEIANQKLAYTVNNSFPTIRKVSNINIKANAFTISIAKGVESDLNISQNYHKHWQCLINGLPTPIEIANICLMKVKLPKEECKVELIFKPTLIIIAYWISISFFVLQIIVLAFLKPRSKN